MPDVNRYYVVDHATWLQAQSFLTRRPGRQASYEILQDRPSLDGPPPSVHLIQAVTSDTEHAWALQHGARYLGDFHVETGQPDQSVLDYLAAPENASLWQSRVP